MKNIIKYIFIILLNIEKNIIINKINI